MTSLDHVLITGASTGIGLELARLFAADGRFLVLVARQEERLQSVAEKIHAAGIGISTLINNAGFGAYGLFGERDSEVYRRMADLNVGALTEMAAVFLPAMKQAANSGAHFLY